LQYLHFVLRITIPSTAYLQASDATSNCNNGNNASNNAKNVKNPGSNYSVRINWNQYVCMLKCKAKSKTYSKLFT